MGARYLAATPLIGTAMAQTPFQAKAVSKLKGAAKSVVIPTHEFAGPNGAPWIEERLDFRQAGTSTSRTWPGTTCPR